MLEKSLLSEDFQKEIKRLEEQRRNSVEALSYKLLTLILRVANKHTRGEENFEEEYETARKIVEEIYPPIMVPAPKERIEEGVPKL